MTLSLLFSLLFTLEAHRGFSAKYPENTMLAFEKAAKVPVFGGMETDVQMTSDGVLVCMHDDTIDRTTNGTGAVADYTYRQLMKFRIDAGNGIENVSIPLRVPKFKDYLRVCRKAGFVPCVELKLLSPEGIVKTIETLRAEGFTDDRYVLTSFKLEYLLEAEKHCEARLEYMSWKFTEDMIKPLAGHKNFIIRPRAKDITPEFAELCRSLGFRMEAWGLDVGDSKTLRNLRYLGVEGATCNDWQGLGFIVPSSGKVTGPSIAVFGGSLSSKRESDTAKQIWADKLGADVTTYGVGGAGFGAAAGYTLQKQVEEAGVHDIYVLWASTNDFGKGISIGTPGVEDRSTQCGGIEYCIRRIYEKNPRARIVFFTSLPFFRNDGGYNPGSEMKGKAGFTFNEYVVAQRACCAIHGIPVLDQFVESGLGPYNFQNYYNPDKLHLSDEGYRYISVLQLDFLSRFIK